MSDYQDFHPPSVPLGIPAPNAPELAGRGARLGARCLDFLALTCAVSLAGGIAILAKPGLLKALHASRHDEATLSLMIPVMLAVGAMLVWDLWWLHRYGQTIGKRMLGIRIVRCDGTHAPLWRIVCLRDGLMTALEGIPLLGPFIGLTDSLVIFRADRRCLHDMIADTKVVRIR